MLLNSEALMMPSRLRPHPGGCMGEGNHVEVESEAEHLLTKIEQHADLHRLWLVTVGAMSECIN